METKFVNSIVARGGAKDFVATKLNIKVSEFREFLDSAQVAKLLEANNGWLRVEVLKSKNDQDKHYVTLNEWTPNKVTSAGHSPDRNTADEVPF